MASTFFFNGQLYTTPTTVSAVNDTAMAPTGPTVGNVVAYIGQATDGKPNTVYRFGDPDQVAPVFGSGDLVTACKKAFNPSNDSDVNAPGTVIGIRVGTSTPATVTLMDANANPVITLTSDSYGQLANLCKVQVETGSLTGKLLMVQKGTTYYNGDNTARNAFTVQYTGAAPTATMTINNSTVTLAAPIGTVVATIPLATFPTVANLADRISATPGFVASAVVGSGGTPSLNGLDSVTAQDVKTALYTATANLQACVDWFNNVSGLVTATRVANAGAPPANIGWTYLAGGTDPTVLTGDWTNALSTLQGVDCQWVTPLSGDPAIHAATDAHVQYMSTVGKKERRAFVGPAAGTTQASVIALPVNINSDRTALCWPGYYDYDTNGNLALYPSYMTAALVAAAFAAASPGTAMTNHTVTVRGLEFYPRNPTDTDVLIQAGVLCLDEEPTGYKVVRSISTWLVNNNYNRVEVSCGAATDYAVRTVRQAVDVLRGGRQDPQQLTRAETITLAALKGLAVPVPEGPGVIVGDANSPPFQNISASLSGDDIIVSWQMSPVIPTNFIGCSVSIQPYSGTATAATSTAAT